MTRRLAILDDFQGVALALGDWERVRCTFDIDVFRHSIPPNECCQTLQPYEAIVAMRERTPFQEALIRGLGNLRFIATTGMWNRAIDMQVAARNGIVVCGTDSSIHAPVELAWALIFGIARRIHLEDAEMRRGNWQTGMGVELHGKTLAVLGLGRLGREMVRIGRAFGMNVIAWSQNLTAEGAESCGARWTSKDDFFREADVLTIHVVLSGRTHGLVGRHELALMKPTALLVNTSRGAIVDELALVDALRRREIGGAALDVYSVEPPPLDDPLRSAPNTLLTSHIGITTDRNYATYFTQIAENVGAYLSGNPIRVLNSAITPPSSRA